MRIGHGYDVHTFQEGRKLIIGGVEIPYNQGLAGHSDADVLCHAISDALLGALALGDIGKLFPDSDPAFKNANSLLLLEKVGEVLLSNKYVVGNIDSTIVAENPKMAPHILAMRENISTVLHISLSSVSVKATTEETLGFTGRGEGISAHAVCLVEEIQPKFKKL